MAFKDPERRREYLREYNRRRKEDDPEYAERCREASRRCEEKRKERRRADPEFRQRENDRIKSYATPERVKAWNANRAPSTDEQRKERNAKSAERWHSNSEVRERAAARWRERVASGDPSALAAVKKGRYYNRAKGSGLTREDIQAMRDAQGGCCAVCGVVPGPTKDGRDPLHVDHRHDNGAIRGMLCNRCNQAAGVLDRDPEYLRKLAEYVQRGADPGTHEIAVVEPFRPILREVG